MYEKVCRLCLVKPSVYFSVLEPNISAMLEALTFTQVSPHDEISTIVCLKCVLNLKWAYNIQQRIKKNEKKLLDQVNVKQEPHSPLNIKTDGERCNDLVKLCDKCTICGDSVDETLLNDHIRNHFNNDQKCTLCDKSFLGIQAYREHLSEQHEKSVHNCGNCGAKFGYESLYELHKKTHCLSYSEALKERIVNLGVCSTRAIKVLAEGSELQNSNGKIPVADQTVDLKAMKKIAKLGLRSSKAIKTLMGEDVKDEKRVCNICSKTFTKYSFASHTHETKTCNICNKEVSKYWYKKHVEDHTSGPQICHLCGATLKKKSCLVTHMYYSHNAQRYKCDDCGKKFRKKNARDVHRQKEHIGQPTLYCDTCGKGFFTSADLNKHNKMKHLKLRPHICDFCKKGFSSKYALRTHQRQHTNETPYKCEVCGDGFRQNVSLRAHRKSKHNIIEETIVSCKVCDKGFASDSALYAHMRLH